MQYPIDDVLPEFGLPVLLDLLGGIIAKGLDVAEAALAAL
jgi:hypothetical protein